MTNYEYGRQCFYKGNLNNPFRDGTYKHKEWLRNDIINEMDQLLRL